MNKLSWTTPDLKVFPFRDVFRLLPSLPEALNIVLSILSPAMANDAFRAYLGTRHGQQITFSPQRNFDIDHESGFFPSRPLPALPDYYRIWEDALVLARAACSLGEDLSDDASNKRASSAAWRASIDSWPVLPLHSISNNERLLQRAHLVLAWLTHFYVHSIPDIDQVREIHVPKALAVPLVQVSEMLGTAPILTYADTVLYNWELIDPSKPVSGDNIKFTNLFSGTQDEVSFYLVSAKVELAGAELLQIIEDGNTLNISEIASARKTLLKLRETIANISEIMQELRTDCNPHVFYWAVRPWFDGADSNADGPRWIYDGVGPASVLDTSGPSGGQSSTMHALDVLLDIDHKYHHQKKLFAQQHPNGGFMEKMRRYMPRKHREFLEQLSSSPHSIRLLAQRSSVLKDPYDEAVTELKELRDEHIRIVCLYVINMKRGSRGQCPMMARAKRGPVKGTGGTDLAQLLKAGRDATKKAVLQA